MKTRYKENYESDPTPSREIARRYREVIYDDDREESLTLLHYRGGDEEFQIGREFCQSDDAGDRAAGADILAQLGWNDHAFQDESVAILTELLGDADHFVVYCAAVGLGHRSAASSIPALLELIEHPDEQVRFGVVFGLLEHEDDSAIDALIQLAGDEDHEVRNWAVFGLGTQIESDSPSIRDALRKALGDSDHEIRGEALVGLARRGDFATVPELINEWRDNDVSLLSIDAAVETHDPRLYHRLKDFTEILSLESDPHFAGRLADAIEACKPKAENSFAEDELR